MIGLLCRSDSEGASSLFDPFNNHFKTLAASTIPRIDIKTLYENFNNSNGTHTESYRTDTLGNENLSKFTKLNVQQIFNLSHSSDDHTSLMRGQVESKRLPLPFQNLSREHFLTRMCSEELDNTIINTSSTSNLIMLGGYPKNEATSLNITERAILHQMLLNPYNSSDEY